MNWNKFEDLFARYKTMYQADAARREAEEDERYRLLGEEIERHPIFNPTRRFSRPSMVDSPSASR